MPDMPTDKSDQQIPTNLRLLVLIERIAAEGTPMTPSALSAALGLPKPTVHRLLATAEDEGLVQRGLDGQGFGPGARMRKMSANTLSSERIRTERLLILSWLAEQVGETCNLAVPGRHGMVYLERVETQWPLRIQLPVGTQVPFHCTASGKMYLSSLRSDKFMRLMRNSLLEKKTQSTIADVARLSDELAIIRERDFSTDNQEFMDGMTAIAVPIRDDQRRLLSTLSLHAPVQRMDLNDLSTHLGVLRQAAGRLESLLC